MDARLDPGIGSGQLFPRIETARLRLRAFRLADAAELQRLAGDRQVAEGTLLPHPYEGGTARAWIWEQALAYAAGNGIDFAIERAEDDRARRRDRPRDRPRRRVLEARLLAGARATGGAATRPRR